MHARVTDNKEIRPTVSDRVSSIALLSRLLDRAFAAKAAIHYSSLVVFVAVVLSVVRLKMVRPEQSLKSFNIQKKKTNISSAQYFHLLLWRI